MFDSKNGERIVREMYDFLCDEEDVDLWTADPYYHEVSCFENAIDEWALFHRDGVDLTDVIAYLVTLDGTCLNGETFWFNDLLNYGVVTQVAMLMADWSRG